MFRTLDIGACESCPSSTTTMKMGIERVLKEKFGEAIKDIRQVYDERVVETTVEVNIFKISCKLMLLQFKWLKKCLTKNSYSCRL